MVDSRTEYVRVYCVCSCVSSATCNACPKRKAYFCNWGMLGCWLNYTTASSILSVAQIRVPSTRKLHVRSCTLTRPILKLNERSLSSIFIAILRKRYIFSNADYKMDMGDRVPLLARCSSALSIVRIFKRLTFKRNRFNV